ERGDLDGVSVDMPDRLSELANALGRAAARGVERAHDVEDLHRATCVEHHSRQTRRYAASIRFANAGSSMRTDRFMRPRSPARIRERPSRSPARSEQARTKVSSSCTASSGIPTAASSVNPWRAACVGPARLTTGTPIHSASHVVVTPWYGKV